MNKDTEGIDLEQIEEVSKCLTNITNPAAKPALLIGRPTTHDHESTNQKPAFVFAAGFEVGIAGSRVCIVS